VEAMVLAVREKVERDDVVVLMGLDNGTYYEEDEEGTRRLPRKDEEHVYHVEGKLVVAAPRQVVGLMKNCREVLDEVPDNRKVLMGPGPRYLRCKCCDKQGHVTNFEERGYRKDIICDLQEAKEALVDMCRECELRNYKVTSPVDLMGLRAHMEEAEVEALLGTDPVHYSVTGFATMARNLIDMRDLGACSRLRRGVGWWRRVSRTGLTWVAGGEATQSGYSTRSLVSEAGEEAGPTGEGASSR